MEREELAVLEEFVREHLTAGRLLELTEESTGKRHAALWGGEDPGHVRVSEEAHVAGE